MGLINALAVVIALLGGIGTYLVLGPLGFLGLAIWAILIAWGCFYHNGGGVGGLTSTIAGNVWGVIIGTLALFLIPTVGFGLIGTAGVVIVTVAILILGAHVPFLSSIPTGLYGFASTVGFGLMTSANALDLSLGSGPLPTIALSMVVGAILGFISEKIAGLLA